MPVDRTDDGSALLRSRALAILLFAVALLLSLPGIRVARADEPDMTPVSPDEFVSVEASPADTCESTPAAPAPSAAPVRTAQRVAPAPPDLRPGEPGVEASPGVVVLNNRGYNYAPTQGPNPAQWLEVEREAAAAD